jgi:hypothetical protein
MSRRSYSDWIQAIRKPTMYCEASDLKFDIGFDSCRVGLSGLRPQLPITPFSTNDRGGLCLDGDFGRLVGPITSSSTLNLDQVAALHLYRNEFATGYIFCADAVH